MSVLHTWTCDIHVCTLYTSIHVVVHVSSSLSLSLSSPSPSPSPSLSPSLPLSLSPSLPPSLSLSPSLPLSSGRSTSPQGHTVSGDHSSHLSLSPHQLLPPHSSQYTHTLSLSLSHTHTHTHNHFNDLYICKISCIYLACLVYYTLIPLQVRGLSPSGWR